MAAEDFKRKLSAILSADVEGYSRLMGEDEDATIRTLTTYRELMSTLIQKHRGRVVDSPGDNLLAEFGSVVDAVRCAVEVQEELRVRNAELPENRRMQFRIGINLGDVVEEEERIYGDGINIAARVEGLAEGGGICISGAVYDSIKNKLSLSYEPLGEHTVKNITEPVRVYRMRVGPEAEARKEVGPKRWRLAALAIVLALILIIGAVLIWNFYIRRLSVEPASIEGIKPAHGSLYVKTEPSGAEVLLEDKFRGTAPINLSGLSIGRIKVKITKEGYMDQEEMVFIREGRETSLTVVLDPIVTKGSIKITSEPSGARWYLDGEYVGTTPDEMKSLDQGKYKVEVKKDGYEEYSETVIVRAGELATFFTRLDPLQTSPGGSLGKTWREPLTGMEFAWVPGGCYQMGCGGWDEDCYDSEKPVHEVCVDGFWIGKYEVTQGQWKKVMDNNPSSFKKGDNYPIEQVSWKEAKVFIQKLNSMNNSRYEFRLPTEAEWEYACRSGGKTEKYAGGGDVTQVAWYSTDSGKSTHRVGTKAPNGLGIYDMSGNVWEWCEDIYSTDAYRKHQRNNPIYNSGGSLRVIRGGSWGDASRYVRCSNRYGFQPVYKRNTVGFRLVRTP